MDSNNWRVKHDTTEKEQTRTPTRSYQQRRSNLNDPSFSGNSSSPFGNGRRSFPFQDQSRDGLRKPLSDDKVDKAIEEGRRVYVGNLPYEVSLVHSLLLSDWSCRSPWPISPSKVPLQSLKRTEWLTLYRPPFRMSSHFSKTLQMAFRLLTVSFLLSCLSLYANADSEILQCLSIQWPDAILHTVLLILQARTWLSVSWKSTMVENSCAVLSRSSPVSSLVLEEAASICHLEIMKAGMFFRHQTFLRLFTSWFDPFKWNE